MEVMAAASATTTTADVSSSSSSSPSNKSKGRNRVRVTRKTLEDMLFQLQQTLQSIDNPNYNDDDNDDDDDEDDDDEDDSPSQSGDSENNELCDLLKSTFVSPNFLEKLGSIHQQNMAVLAEEGNSWDMVSDNDLWDGGSIGAASDSAQEGFVLVRDQDIVDGIALYTATYISSLKETKKLTPEQLQEALCKTFSAKKRKGKLRKAWDGSKVIYNVASWGATAIGIYQNPALIRAASMAFWNSCNLISKLL